MPIGIREWFQQVTDRALEILDLNNSDSPLDDLVNHCNSVLSRKGEATGLALASAVVESWRRLPISDHLAFFEYISDNFGPDIEELTLTLDKYRDRPCQELLTKIHKVSEPRRQELFRRINAAPDGLEVLIHMRESLGKLIQKHSKLDSIDMDFIHLFGSWFNKGFLRLENINWQTPAATLEKLIQYESVHEIHGWDDLRRRLAKDRLCFAYFHPVIPDEPIIFVEVALVNGIARAIEPLLTTVPGSPDNADTAVFYSINNCQPGLTGISFGNLLIKQVVSVLQQEHPKLKNFVTLSPIPGLRKWMAIEYPEFHSKLENSPNQEEFVGCVIEYLTTLRKGKLIDPVARFHLGNGAMLERVNSQADLSQRGKNESYGFMVNYLYEMDSIVINHEQLMEHGTIAMSKEVKGSLNSFRGSSATLRKKN